MTWKDIFEIAEVFGLPILLALLARNNEFTKNGLLEIRFIKESFYEFITEVNSWKSGLDKSIEATHTNTERNSRLIDDIIHNNYVQNDTNHQ